MTLTLSAIQDGSDRAALEKRLRKIVRGQVRSYMNDHPEMFSEKVLKPSHRRSVEIGISKRVVPDILTVLANLGCGQVAARAGGSSVPSQEVPAGVVATAPAGRCDPWADPITRFFSRVFPT